MVEPQAAGLGLEIVRVRVSGARVPVLQIMTERPGGAVSVEDCARLSRRLSPLLEENDPMPGEYTLEVSSPGIDRPLTRIGDFARWAGHEARVELAAPVDGRRRFHGFIVSEADGMIDLRLKDGSDARLPFSDMVKAHLVLTDDLIEAVRSEGLIPADAADDDFEGDFDDVEVESDDGSDGETPSGPYERE
jgi:ribosome maturation factor RimP